MNISKLEEKVINGNLNIQEKKKLIDIYRQYAHKTNTTLIVLTQKGNPLKWTYISSNGTLGYKVKSNCLEEKTYKESKEKIEELFLKKISREIPESRGIRGKIKGYLIKKIKIPKNY